jgi:opacity protein-like surface antigen
LCGVYSNVFKGDWFMKKVFLIVCCFLILTTAASAEWWVGGQLGSTFTGDSDVTFKAPPFKGTLNGIQTQSSFMTGAIVGYNFGTTANAPEWARYFGAAIDFSYNGFSQAAQTRTGSIIPPWVRGFNLPQTDGYQLALAFLARVHYPCMIDEAFPRGRLLPYIMFGPAIVWTNVDFSNYAGSSQTSTNAAFVAETGLEYFITPQLTIGPAFRYRHTWNPSFNFQRSWSDVSVSSQSQNQYTVMARVTYHFF